MYDLFVKEGITDVFNSGDMTEGNGRIYRGQVYEMFNHGADGQRDYLIEKYPSRPGITTHCIAGNHDYSFVESDGHDIIKGFALQRDDINYLGIYQADIIYNGVHIRLQHGAASGKGTDVLERYLKAYGEKDTPDILIVGHYHTAVMTRYNNCVAVTGGGWHADSHYLKRLGIKSEAMGWIFHVTVDRTTGKIIRCAPELIVFPEMLDHDF
jgi:predicted phosphodiesterase